MNPYDAKSVNKMERGSLESAQAYFPLDLERNLVYNGPTIAVVAANVRVTQTGVAAQWANGRSAEKQSISAVVSVVGVSGSE